VHSACADFHIVGLLKHANPASPQNCEELQNQILELRPPSAFSQVFTFSFSSALQKIARPEPALEVVLDPGQRGFGAIP